MMDYLTESISPGLIFELQLYFLSGTHVGQLGRPTKVCNSRFVHYSRLRITNLDGVQMTSYIEGQQDSIS